VDPDGPGYAAPAQGGAGRGEAEQRGADQGGADQHLTDAGAGSAGARTVDIGGQAAADPAAVTDRHTLRTGSDPDTVASTSQGADSEGRERHVSADRAQSYGSRWDEVKGEFVDEPRKAVADADALVGELLVELQTLFTEQREGIERSMATDETSTEDLRLALRRYRSFFDRLLSI
jgi:hypothetical protein